MKYLGIDIGGTRIKYVLYDKKGIIADKGIFIRDRKKDIVEIIVSLVNKYPMAEKIGVAVAGWVTLEGYIFFAPNLFIKDYDLGSLLREQIDKPIYFDNDMNATLNAEILFGKLNNYGNILSIFFGTGIGTAASENGKIIRGKNNVAMEGGHIIIEKNGYACRCGKNGCFEAYCGGDYISDRWKGFLKSKGLKWDEKKIYSLKDIMESPYGEDMFYSFVERSSDGIAILTDILSPEIILIGGGVISGIPNIAEMIKTEMRNKVLIANRDIDIIFSQMTEYGGAMGVIPKEDL